MTAELTADLFVSLDGFAAGEDVGPYFGYGAPELDGWISAELERPQVLSMGRVTYELMAPLTASADELAEISPSRAGWTARFSIPK